MLAAALVINGKIEMAQIITDHAHVEYAGNPRSGWVWK
jgi:hypothetical protein